VTENQATNFTGKQVNGLSEQSLQLKYSGVYRLQRYKTIIKSTKYQIHVLLLQNIFMTQKA